jgi:nucleotide-binding universal stress UspA family protein
MMTLPLDVVHVAHDHLTGQNVLREAHEYLRPYDAVPGVETILREGAAAEQILGAASERGAGLIVMGAHGHSRLYEVLLGSVTDGVLRNANRPLLMSK